MFRKQISKDDTVRKKAIGRQWLFFNFFDIFIDTSLKNRKHIQILGTYFFYILNFKKYHFIVSKNVKIGIKCSISNPDLHIL